MTAKTRKSKSTSGPPRHGSLKPKDPRRGVLAAWRGIDLADAEKARAPRAKPINGIMPGVLKSMGLDRRRTEAEILRVWNHLIDPNIVADAQPTGLRKGTLFVTVDHSVWLSEIVRRSQSQRFKENGAHLSGDRVCYRKWLFFFLFFALLSVRIT